MLYFGVRCYFSESLIALYCSVTATRDYEQLQQILIMLYCMCTHWRRQLWATRASSTSNCLINFSGRFRAAQTLTLDSYKLGLWLSIPTITEYTGLYLCQFLLHEFHNILVCYPKIICVYFRAVLPRNPVPV